MTIAHRSASPKSVQAGPGTAGRTSSSSLQHRTTTCSCRCATLSSRCPTSICVRSRRRRNSGKLSLVAAEADCRTAFPPRWLRSNSFGRPHLNLSQRPCDLSTGSVRGTGLGARQSEPVGTQATTRRRRTALGARTPPKTGRPRSFFLTKNRKPVCARHACSGSRGIEGKLTVHFRVRGEVPRKSSRT